jgi:hypothetical protein
MRRDIKEKFNCKLVFFKIAKIGLMQKTGDINFTGAWCLPISYNVITKTSEE